MSCGCGHLGFPIGIKNTKFQISVFYADWKSKMAATAGHRLTLDPMEIYSNAFFSETTWTVETNCPGMKRRSVLKHFSHRVQC
jgi:hypothetical protein